MDSKEKLQVYQTILVLCLATLLAFWYWGNSILLYLALGLLFIGIVIYPAARLIHLAWMEFAHLLGWVNTRILLGLIFFLALWPLAAIRQLFKQVIIHKKPDSAVNTYFHKREEQLTADDFERLW